MKFQNRLLLIIICLNIITCLIKFDEDVGEAQRQPLKQVKSFEEFDEIMSNSEFSKAWENFKNMAKVNEEVNNYQNDFDPLFENPKFKMSQKNFFEENDDENNNENAECLLSKEETKEYLRKMGKNDDNPSDEARFIFGKCNPVILVPGMLSTKLQVKINCKGLYNDEIDKFKKMRFYCGSELCSDINNTNESRDLFISVIGPFQLVEYDVRNKYAACTGYFLTFFNSKNACASYDEKNDDYICNYSENVKIGFYGYRTGYEEKSKCGLNAIKDVVQAEGLDSFVNRGALRSFGPLIENLEAKGYKAGFSLGGIPNDYRQFLAINNFTYEAFRYQIEKLYENTGKPVVIISHSFGTITSLNTLVYKKNKDILHKIKKFIAVAPPFAGSTQLIDLYFNDALKYSTQITIYGRTITAGFDVFGFGFIINKLPTAFELRPLPIIGDLFTKPGYEIFADAMKERFFLEKKCGYNKCDRYIINKYSRKFNALFGEYFPSLLDEDCQFEQDLEDTDEVFGRKCLLDMHNMFNCPTIVEEAEYKFQYSKSDFDSYCGKIAPNIYYQKSCDNTEKQCIDQLYSKHVNYIFTKSNEKLKYFMDLWKTSNFDKTLGDVNEDFYPEETKYKASPQIQIEYYENISITKDMPIPHVDTDIIFSKFSPTVASFIYDKNNFNHNYTVQKKGGDGVVPNWAPVIPGLKWIYDTKKYNLKTKVKLIEFCSRLAKNSKYTYDPLNPDQKFGAISCSCLDENNKYSDTNCGHAMMIQDQAFFDYIDSVINDPKLKNELTDDKKNAYNRYEQNKDYDYEKSCNDALFEILENSMENNKKD